MLMTRAAACALMLLAASGCATDPPEQGPDPTPAAAAPLAEQAPAPAPRTVDLRFRVKPQTDKLFSVTLPRQPAGGTLVTWSAFLSGIGAAANAAAPLKAECYVVQATGKSFEDRVFYLADDSTVSTGDDISLSGSGVVDTADGRRLVFECELDENRPQPISGLRWETVPQEPIQVTLTPLPAYQQKTRTVR